MLNRLASLAMSTSVLKDLPGKLDIKRHSPITLYVLRAISRKTVVLGNGTQFFRGGGGGVAPRNLIKGHHQRTKIINVGK